MSGRFAFSRQIGHIGAGVVPLGGNYDCDDKADLAVYEPSTARFKLLRSEQSWGTMITHQFDTAFIPWPSGTQQARAGATAVGGFSAGKLCGSPVAFSKRVRAAAVYFPYDSTWNMLWDVTGATKIQSCSLGSGDASNQIVGGLQLDPFDPFLPFISPTDIAMFRTFGSDEVGQLMTRRLTTCGPSGSSWTDAALSRPRHRVWAVNDMNGNGTSEIFILNPDTMGLTWLSGSGSTQRAWLLPRRAEVL